MKLSVFRQMATPKSTPGTMEVNGVFQCYTLEKAATFNGQPNVPDETRIPAGSYRINLLWSHRHQCIKPWVMDVPGRADIEIDIANTPDELLGCTAVGETRATDSVGNSELAFKALMARLMSVATMIDPTPEGQSPACTLNEPITIDYVDYIPVQDVEL